MKPVPKFIACTALSLALAGISWLVISPLDHRPPQSHHQTRKDNRTP